MMTRRITWFGAVPGGEARPGRSTRAPGARVARAGRILLAIVLAATALSHWPAAPAAEAEPANSPATGAPTITGTARVGETLTAVTSGIADADGLSDVSYAYQWIRTAAGADADIADATGSTYTLSGDDEGTTIKVQVAFDDDDGNSETLTSASTAAVDQGSQVLVSNLGVGVSGAGGIQRALHAARPGFAQAFTTGADSEGYALGSIGVQVSRFQDGWTVGDHLRVTINGAASAGGPGGAFCTLSNPSSFSAPGVIVFTAPAGAGSCPQLTKETTYFVVIEWVDPGGADSFALIPQTYPTEEEAARGEDPGGAEGWSIADRAHYLSVSPGPPTWVAFDETASFKIRVQEAAIPAETGVPTISGTVQEGETLTADITAITDPDGLTNASYRYQWLADDTDVEGATGQTYELTGADVGKTIRVRVSFTDDAGNEETLTSAATAAVAAALVPLTVALENNPVSHDGWAEFTFEIRFSEHIAELSYVTLKEHAFTETGGTVERAKRLEPDSDTPNLLWRITVRPAGNGDVTIVLPETTDCNAQGAICTEDDRALSNRLELTVTGPDSAVQNSPATGAATISGTAQVGETLTAVTSGIADLDGLDNAAFSYQWTRNDGNAGRDIENATGSTYQVSSGDVGKTIKVRVSFTDDRGANETLTSAATAAVTARPNSPATGAPTISGTAQVGQTLTAGITAIADADGLTNAAFSYQWLAGDTGIEGATGSTYTVSDEDVGKLISVRVSFTDDRGANETLTSAATAAVTARPNSPATGAPTVDGTAQAGQTLTAGITAIADADGLTNAAFSYQWLADDAGIEGATGSTYTVSDEDVGKPISVRVSFTDDRGANETLTSDATAAVTAAPSGEADSGDEGPIWSATLTAGALGTDYGYDSHFNDPPVGSLTSDSFQIDEETYTVKQIGAGWYFYIAFDKELPSGFDFTVEVEGNELDSDDSIFWSASYGNVYKWDDAGTLWREGDVIELRLLRSN